MIIQNITVIGRRRESVPKTSKVFVSLFRDYSNPKPIGEIDLLEFLLTSTYQQQVEEIRRCTDKARRRELKSKLSAITPSGIFSKRSNAGLIRHSGIICVDVDQQDNAGISDWEALKSSISDLQGLWYAGRSVSGNGLFLLFKVKYPEKHLEHFAALARELTGRGIAVDQACKDVARLRGASYDPNPFFNPDAAPFDGLLTASTQRATGGPSTETQRNLKNPVGYQGSDDLTAYRVGRLIERIEATGTNLAECYPEWFAIGRALASEFGEYGREWFHAVSSKSQKYDPDECDQQYSRCLRACDRTSIGTFFNLCKQNGVMLK